MKEILLEQGSKEWLEWRKTRITASECPIIAGISKYDTPFKLWQYKLGLAEKKVTKAMQDGSNKEAAARDAFNMEHGTNFVPIVAQSDEYEFLGASLDGWWNGEVLEIKHNGEKNHALATQGKIPDDHYCQMQVQMLVTGARKCTYLSVGHSDKVHIPVEYEHSYCMALIPKLKEFYRKLVCFEAPALQQGDYKEMHSKGWDELSEKYINLDREIKAKEEMKEVIRKQLIALAADENCRGNGIRLQKTVTKGRVEYGDIPELKGVNLDPYRKEQTISWRVLVEERIS